MVARVNTVVMNAAAVQGRAPMVTTQIYVAGQADFVYSTQVKLCSPASFSDTPLITRENYRGTDDYRSGVTSWWSSTSSIVSNKLAHLNNHRTSVVGLGVRIQLFQS